MQAIRNLTPKIFILLLLSAVLSGCGGQNARDIIGLGKRAPDEFRVVSRPPLSVPPDFTLRPPREDGFEDTNRFTSDADQRARNTITRPGNSGGYFGSSDTAIGAVSGHSLPSSADENFLQKAGANYADPTIRDRLYQDYTRPVKQESEQEYLFNWFTSNENKGEVIVDAKAEQERLERNKEMDKPVTEGETPSIEPRQPAPLEQLFN